MATARCAIRPVMWNRGATPSTTSAGVRPAQSRYAWALKTTFRCVFIAPFGGPVVPDVYVRNATSSGSSRTGSKRSPAKRRLRSRRSCVSSGRRRRISASSGGTVSPRRSSSDVVTATRTPEPGSTDAATSSCRDSRLTSAAACESRRTNASSRSFSIGLTGTTMPPTFQVASIATANCGTFWRYTATRSPRSIPSSPKAAASPSLRIATSSSVSVLSK